jgi:hypothetical protein
MAQAPKKLTHNGSISVPSKYAVIQFTQRKYHCPHRTKHRRCKTRQISKHATTQKLILPPQHYDNGTLAIIISSRALPISLSDFE